MMRINLPGISCFATVCQDSVFVVEDSVNAAHGAWLRILQRWHRLQAKHQARQKWTKTCTAKFGERFKD